MKSNITFYRKKRFLVTIFVFSLLFLAVPMRSSAMKDLTTGTLTAEITNQSFTFDSNPDPYSGTLLPESAFPFPDDKIVRVAIYNEPNFTETSYTGGNSGVETNNISKVIDVLSVKPNIQVSVLTEAEIAIRGVLTTANFDVLIIPDVHPREWIIDMIQDFWLGGGGILTLDGAALFLNYFGILPPEAATTHGYGTYWTYGGDGFNFTLRHPAAKAYSIDAYVEPPGLYGHFAWDWTALSGSVIAADLYPFAHDFYLANQITGLAFDPTDRGGKIVTIGHDLTYNYNPDIDALVLNSVEWLAPSPKARIAFDHSHQPRLSLDTWDPYTLWPGYYEGTRDHLVANGYTVDKLWPAPAGDNFTLDRLMPYDMLIINTPDFNYTAGDMIAIEEWVTEGGSLLAMGDYPSEPWFRFQNDITNQLLAPFGLSINIDLGVLGTATFTDFTLHPITEDTASGLAVDVYGYVNLTGPAFPIWFDAPDGNVIVGGSEYGNGRVICISDINWLQSIGGNLDLAANRNILRNIANWLTSAKANVLVYTDWIMNPYKTSVALALNDLGVNYFLTYGVSGDPFEYLNHSLNFYPWDMVIVDNPNYFGLEFFFDELIEYIDTGGHLMMSYFNVDAFSAHPIWAKLGFAFNADFTTQPPLYIWDAGHDIFNQPVDYNAVNFTAGTFYADDGDRLTVFSNATALAGYTITEQPDEAIIVLRNDEQTLFNSYLIDYFDIDIDDSTYLDNFELWKNEIAFMLRPKLEFLPDFPATKTVDITQSYRVEIPNVGLSDATIGLIEIFLPPGFASTSDDLIQPFNVAKDEVGLVEWNIVFDTEGNYTLTFDAIYQGYIGTIYGTGSLLIDITVTKAFDLPIWVWYIVGGVLGALVILIIIVALIKRSKKNMPTR